MKFRTCFAILSAVVVLLLSGCATHIRSTLVQNPPPAETFSKFTRFTLGAARLAKPYAGQPANERALAKIQENLSAQMTPVLAGWNNAGKSSGPVRTLVIDPVVKELKFINGNARFWVGPMAGSSAVVLQVRIYEYETGKVVATPEFYARASAMGGTFTIGATDNVMLVRIADRLSGYLKGNYDQAIGGPTGVDSN